MQTLAGINDWGAYIVGGKIQTLAGSDWGAYIVGGLDIWKMEYQNISICSRQRTKQK
jgi:hypothetical protein